MSAIKSLRLLLKEKALGIFFQTFLFLLDFPQLIGTIIQGVRSHLNHYFGAPTHSSNVGRRVSAEGGPAFGGNSDISYVVI